MSTTVAQRHPIRELLARYGAVLGAAWAARDELAGPKRMADEAAFLPAALSLQETPVHPAPRRVAWALCALFTIALIWSIVGEIDIVAVAPGRIVVSENTKAIQPLEASVVRRVLVKDGDAVQAGQVLVELDSTNASADGASVQEQLAAAVSEERRTTVLLASLQTGRAPVLPKEAREAAQLQAEWLDVSAKLAKLGAEHARREAEMATVREVIAKLEATLPIARQREADFKSLSDQGFMSSHAGQDRTRERIEQERDLATQRARLTEARAALTETENARASYVAETRRQLSDRQSQATLKRQQFTQERSKTEHRQRLTQLTAPVTGTVQQLTVHTEGGVVTPAQVLMIVVPKDAQVTAEVVVDNKDIGFVNAGQIAAIKLETFPFTRYGTVDAKVETVTADAVNDEKRGAIFPATLTLQRSSIDVDGKRIRLSPGMNVTAEIKTGRRKVIDYLLSPVEKTMRESLGNADMRLLVIHQNFPGQFGHLVREWAQRPGWQVRALGRETAPGLPSFDGLTRYRLARTGRPTQHAYLRQMEAATLHGQAAARAMLHLRREGFVPDVILAHPGWGETLYAKDVFPDARLVHLCEWYYSAQGADLGFDPEFPITFDDRARIRTWNALHTLNLTNCDAAVSPTRWQRSRHPEIFQRKIVVQHEGIATDELRPDSMTAITTPSGVVLKAGDPVITYVARNLEPYRGFHVFMRALERIQGAHPHCHAVIVGGDEVSYGKRPKDAANWREQMLREVTLDASRTHFMGRIPRAEYLRVLQVSAAHVYLSYPFVLSWSLLEAMACGAAIVASNTAPVREVIDGGRDGTLVDFFDEEDWARKVVEVLAQGPMLAASRESARATVQQYGRDRGLAGYDRLIGAETRRPQQRVAVHDAKIVA